MSHLNPPHDNLGCQGGALAPDCIMFLHATFMKLLSDAGSERRGGQALGGKTHNNLWILGNIEEARIQIKGAVHFQHIFLST